MKRLDIIEFLKGYSIFTIIIFHFLQTFNHPGLFGKLISFGGTGVHLFVLLSGLGLYLSSINKPLTNWSFIKKRFSKIYTPYIVVVFISFSIALFIPIYDKSLYALLGHILLFKMFDESIIGSYGYPLWFISMIIQFYLAFSFIRWFKEKLNNSSFFIISLFISLLWAFIIVILEKENTRIWNSFFLRYLWEFALGMIIAEKISNHSLIKERKFSPIYSLIIGIVNCIIYALMALRGGEVGKMFNDIPALIGYTFIAIFIFQLNNKYINKFFIFSGKISYNLYLWHTLILLLILHFTKDISLFITLPLSLVLVYIISTYYRIPKLSK